MTQAPLKSAPTSRVDSMVDAAYARLRACGDAGERIAAAARLMLVIFDDFYGLLCEYPYRAKCAFETMDPHASIRISKERLELYSRYVAEHGPKVLAAFPALADDSKIWDALDKLFVAMIADRYEADIAFSFAHSIRRNISHEIWRPVAYSFPPPSRLRAFSMASVHRRLPVHGRIDAELVASALRVPGFSVPFRDLKGDSQRILKRLTPLAVRRAECAGAGGARGGGCRIFPRSQCIRRRPVGSRRRRHRAVRGRAQEQPAGHLRRCAIASRLGYPRSFQLRARQFSRHHAALLPDLRVPVQPDAAPTAGASLFDHRIQSCRQGGHSERDRRADALTAVSGSRDRPGRRARSHSGSPSRPAPII